MALCVGQVSATQVWHQFGGRARKGIVHRDLKPDLEKYRNNAFKPTAGCP